MKPMFIVLDEDSMEDIFAHGSVEAALKDAKSGINTSLQAAGDIIADTMYIFQLVRVVGGEIVVPPKAVEIKYTVTTPAGSKC